MQHNYKLSNLFSCPYTRWLKNAFLLFLFLFAAPKYGQAQCKAGFIFTVNEDVVTYQSTSTSNNGNPLKLYWNINNNYGLFQYSDTVTWQYSEPDTFLVTLIVYDSVANCRDTFTDVVRLNYAVVCDADFSVTTRNSYPTAYFNVKAKKYNPNFLYIFNYGNGDSDSLTADQMRYYFNNNYTYTYYAAADTYNVCLIVLNTKTGCSDTVCKDIAIPAYVKTKCITNFSYFEADNTIQFNSGSNCHTKHFWDFGDGYTSTDRNPIHSFPKAGTYNIKLVVSGNALYEGDTIYKSVKVSLGYCSADFLLWDWGAQNLNQYLVKFFQTPATKFRLDFGDGTVFTQRDTSRSDSSFVHFYDKAGTYNICLFKTDTIFNCTDTICKTITVGDPVWCYAGFKVNVDDHRNIGLISDSNFVGRYSSKFEWDYGDGNTDAGMGRSSSYHQYAKDGTYTIKLVVSNASKSCSDTYSKTVTVKKIVYYAPIIVYSPVEIDSFIAYLITYNETDSSLKAIDTGYFGKQVDTGRASRYYVFDSLPPGKYRVKIAAAKTSGWYNDYLPTYYDSVLFWEDARVIVLDGETPYPRYAWVQLKRGNNPGGPGFIGGKVSQGANKKEGDPLKDVQVMLLDANRNPVAYTYSAVNGSFKFENIAFGTYEVYTEVLGLKTQSADVSISATNPKVENVEVKVNSKGIVTSIRKQLTEDFLTQPKLYPNPAQHILYLETVLRKSQNTNLVIYNLTGQVVYSQNLNLQLGSQLNAVNIENLPAGLYMLYLKNASGTDMLQYKFVKASK